MDPLFLAFLDEAKLLFHRLSTSSQRLLGRYSSKENEQMLRDLHTFKSSARAVGLTALGELFHNIEQSLGTTQRKKSPVIYTKIFRLVEFLEERLQQGMIREEDTIARSRAIWRGEDQDLPAPGLSSSIQVSEGVYQRLTGATESLLLVKNRMTVLTDALLRALDRSGKHEDALVREHEQTMHDLRKAALDLEAGLREARMVPLSSFLGRLPLIAKDLGRSLGKTISLDVFGGDILADRLVISELGGALGHLVRNAIDHGVSKKGRVTITAATDRDHLRVSVEDDGIGIQYDMIERIARNHHLVPEHETLSVEKKNELLFHPHITTKPHITEISGRGVGMSAVREYVRSVGGTIAVESPVQQRGGTRITLRIPLTLSLVRILLVRVGNGTFGVPLTSIQSSSPFDEKLVETIEGKSFVRIGEELLSLYPLSQALSFGGYHPKKLDSLLLRLKGEHHDGVIAVDSVLHEEDVMVKALPSIFLPISLFRGAAMIGDGRTILILDTEGVLNTRFPSQMFFEDHQHATLTIAERDQLMEIMNVVASHAGGALARRFGFQIELSIPECADGLEVLPEDDWGATSIGVRMNLEGEYPGHLLFEIPEPMSQLLTKTIHTQIVNLHQLTKEEKAFFQEVGQIAVHAVGNMLSKISKQPVMTTMSDIRVDARGALRRYFLTLHDGDPKDLVRVRLWFGVGEGVRTDDHKRTGSITMEFRRDDARRLLDASHIA